MLRGVSYQGEGIPLLGRENLADAAAAIGVQAPQQSAPLAGEELLHVRRREEQAVPLAEQDSRIQGPGAGGAGVPYVRPPPVGFSMEHRSSQH